MDAYRMSQQFRAQGQVNSGKNSKQQQNDPDAFMRLVRHSNSCGSSYSADELTTLPLARS